jgi:hypothetical protein
VVLLVFIVFDLFRFRESLSGSINIEFPFGGSMPSLDTNENGWRIRVIDIEHVRGVRVRYLVLVQLKQIEMIRLSRL